MDLMSMSLPVHLVFQVDMAEIASDGFSFLSLCEVLRLEMFAEVA
jgi:hypothetical protein